MSISLPAGGTGHSISWHDYDLVRRVHEHKSRSIPGFSAHYGVDRLVWFEAYDDPTEAISREKALKKWRRDWKIRLIEDQNPDWRDLYPALLR
jgi:putative endonuclease